MHSCSTRPAMSHTSQVSAIMSSAADAGVPSSLGGDSSLSPALPSLHYVNFTLLNDSLAYEDAREGGGGYFRRRKFNLSLLDLERLFPSMEAAVSGDLQALLIAMYSLAAALSLLGNVTVILVLAFGKRSSVRCYLINLAVSDITMAAFCIPFSYTSFMFHRWIFAPQFCRIAAFMQHVSVTCSVYTLVAIGVDRYKALIHPLNTRWTKSRSRQVIGCIWVFSAVLSLASLVVSDTERFDWGGEWYYECKENWPKTQNEVYEKTYTVLLFVLTFALPVCGLGYTYLSIVGMMCSYRIPGNADPSRDQHHLHAKIKMINMMIAVMACFVLSWFPLQVLQFLIYFVPEIARCRGRDCFAYYMSFFVCHWIAMANSFMNPVIYCFMSKNFREDLLQFLRRCGCRNATRCCDAHPWRRREPSSSFRSININITHKTSVQSSCKTSFRARQHQREECMELRHLKSPLSASGKNQQSSRNSLETPRPGYARTSVRRGKLATTNRTTQDSPKNMYSNSPHRQRSLHHYHDLSVAPPASPPRRCSSTHSPTDTTSAFEGPKSPQNNHFPEINLEESYHPRVRRVESSSEVLVGDGVSGVGILACMEEP